MTATVSSSFFVNRKRTIEWEGEVPLSLSRFFFLDLFIDQLRVKDFADCVQGSFLIGKG